MAKGLAIECVKNSMSCAVCGGGASVSLATLSKLERLAAERSLIDFSVLSSRERDTEVLKLSENEIKRFGYEQTTLSVTSITVFGASRHI